MNKKILIVNANYYQDISSGLLKSALKLKNKTTKLRYMKIYLMDQNILLLSKEKLKKVLYQGLELSLLMLFKIIL